MVTELLSISSFALSAAQNEETGVTVLKKMLLAATVMVVAIKGSAASAVPLLFDYTPIMDSGGSFSFNVDSNPTPISFNEKGFFDVAITNSVGRFSGRSSETFYDLSNGGALADYFGPQLFTGSVASPMFLLSGSYLLTRGSNETGTLTISQIVTSTVPEPATWGMMILGMGAVGFAMRRPRRIHTTAAVA